MKVQIASDLHLEFFVDEGKRFIEQFLDATDVDVLILAGDIFVCDDFKRAKQTFTWFKTKYKNVVYIPGNHEYYGRIMGDARKDLEKAALETGVELLGVGQIAVVEGQRFIGDTMWFPWTMDHALYSGLMSDFSCIKGFIENVFNINKQCRHWFRRVIKPNDIVVTHHLPSRQSVSPQYEHSPLNRFFVSDVEGIIKATKPKLWVHGHTHTPADYMLGKTRVVCNPRGYPGSEPVKNWNKRFIIEV